VPHFPVSSLFSLAVGRKGLLVVILLAVGRKGLLDDVCKVLLPSQYDDVRKVILPCQYDDVREVLRGTYVLLFFILIIPSELFVFVSDGTKRWDEKAYWLSFR